MIVLVLIECSEPVCLCVRLCSVLYLVVFASVCMQTMQQGLGYPVWHPSENRAGALKLRLCHLMCCLVRSFLVCLDCSLAAALVFPAAVLLQ